MCAGLNLLYSGLLTLCMLCYAVPGLEDAVLPEKLVEGNSDVLQVCLPCFVLCLLHCLACGHHLTPCLH